ncbi:hypothetical protein K437DRAFT_253324 [Tilletiaria anomala UBC 951]|uniref:CUE domain-containing protein n=1 Tax=Tilletiaria anomala (strain ATCC 24038 / CBS 436.72 / UBC 951) TaxID=1037660 RepID=A0A066WHL6_TILAU|nr:uncharacterized protein K437DRAFT_253324 [Tilletiaria anomala UBC 951]KDN53296.1 hypothetical protein K437DRAFT_253324 [Tilletiaria anomala UBC 951]
MVAGFAGAPVSKGAIMLVCFSSLLTSTLSWKQYVHLQIVPHLTVYRQYWRIFAHYFCFTDSADLFLGLILIYLCFREQERRLGSTQFFVMLLRIWALHGAILFAILRALVAITNTVLLLDSHAYPVLTHGFATSGPYPITIVVLLHQMQTSPGLWTVQVGPAQFDEKAIQGLLSLLLAFSRSGNVLGSCIAVAITPLCLPWPRGTDGKACSTELRFRRQGGAFARLSASMTSLLSFLLLQRVSRAVVHSLQVAALNLIGNTRKPPRSSRAERRRDPTLSVPAPLPQLSSNFSFNMPRFQIRRPGGAAAQTHANLPDGVQHFLPVTATSGRPPNIAAPDAYDDNARDYVPPAALPDGQLHIEPPPASGIRSIFRNSLPDPVMPRSPSASAVDPPWEQHIAVLQDAFPLQSHESVVQALQESNGSYAQAVERLLSS